MTLKKTPLHEEHIKLAAKMAPFAGYDMPVSYAGIIEEHLNVRNNVGIFDVSHMGEFLVTGAESVNFLNYLTAGNYATLKDGKARYTLMCNKNGGIIDDIIAYRFSETDFLVCVNASNIEKDWCQFSEVSKNFHVNIKNISDETGLIALQGPSAKEVLAEILDAETVDMKPFSVKRTSYKGETVTIASTGYTGEKGFEIFASPEITRVLWQEFLTFSDTYNLQPIGLGARDTLRLEKKYPLYGNDINENTSPIEANLARFVDNSKESYIGKERISSDLCNGVEKLWVFLKVNDKRIPRSGYKVFSKDVEIGHITSGSFSPSLSCPIATAYVKSEFSQPGSKISVDVRGRYVEAEVYVNV
ncbi:MAG: glycine cleavage system aminomethyltransferase GcvT [Nitrospinae bacterium]|nr:glycine cleavage system aminomethyltransferase GcvT [Nitrospinota bacterium]